MSKEPGVTLRILSGLAVRGAFEGGIVAEYEASTGNRVAVDWVPTTLIMTKVAAGEQADVLVLIKASMDELVAQGKVDPATRVEVAHSRLGLAAARGAALPAIGSVEEFKAALLQARSIAYSRAGASGIHFEKVIDQLGIGDAVRSRATVIPAGFTAEKLVTGEADLAVQQVSELLVVPGIEVVGKFPEAFQQVSSFSAAVMPQSPNRAAAEAFLAALNAEGAKAAYLASGVDPAY
ncbi:ABC transporter substrate-binding protein [Roseomonas frigidaquae]|uniref:ABC transporter substrate-binding protein n=1 Tax=Falsiroseomonas frigidaquae TaxID=487318 RepID=A0ABX1ESU0_9PROT|nr:substrate-binding domain-containing protein [Falsiroseomonas frigidaquae]NKE43603.1 ABC transporter substrate-binding protein [Falsiroseomonas frigidaquae]